MTWPAIRTKLPVSATLCDRRLARRATWSRLSLERSSPTAPRRVERLRVGPPRVLIDADGRARLFCQGNRDRGAASYLPRGELDWNEQPPIDLAAPLNTPALRCAPGRFPFPSVCVHTSPR